MINLQSITRMKKSYQPGFTLIELLIYAALVTVLLGAFLTGSYYLITSSNRDRERLAVLENEQFVLQKIERVLYAATDSQISPSSGTLTELTINRGCNDIVRIDQNNATIRYTENSDGDCDVDDQDQPTVLTNSHVTVSGLQFTAITVNDQKAVHITGSLTGQFNSRTIDKTVYVK